MKKLALIISREYITRVRKQSYLITTLLSPLLIYTLFIGAEKLNNNQKNDIKKILVVEQKGDLFLDFGNVNGISSEYTSKSINRVSKILENNPNMLAIYIPSDFREKQAIEIYAAKAIDQKLLYLIENRLQQQYLKYLLKDVGAMQANYEIAVRKNIIGSDNSTENMKSRGILGILLATLIYLSIFLYSNQVMKGIVEEKSNRIAEIIISSVKPFELILGKVIGVGLVGLSQFTLWIACGLLCMLVFKVDQINFNIFSDLHLYYNTTMMLVIFIAYFIGGYLLYSALFAAIASSVDSESESQQYILPVTAPLIFTIMIAQNVILQDPNGSIAYWLSVLPFTSPIAVMVRLPFGIPIADIFLSLGTLAATFASLIWLGSEIYKKRILTYEKAFGFKDFLMRINRHNRIKKTP